MEVLYLTNIPSPYRVDFFNELGKICELTVLFEKKSASDREWIAENAKYYKEIYLSGITTGADTCFCPSVIKHLSNKQYDHIIVGGYSTPTGMVAIEYMRRKKIPFILNCDGGIIKDDKKKIKRIKEYFISSANYWLSPSDYATNYLIHYGARKEKIFKYPFTSLKKIDILDCPPSNSEKEIYRKELGMTEDKIVIGVGSFIYRKGFDVLLKASVYFQSNTGVYIIGGKPTEEYIKFVKDNDLSNIHFLNFKGKEDLTKYYKAADVFVLPTRYDVWGLVINEAMANGLPIVTTDKCVAGLELVEKGVNGYVVPTNEADPLSKSVLCIISCKKLENKMSLKSLEKIKKYSIEQMAAEHFEILKNLR